MLNKWTYEKPYFLILELLLSFRFISEFTILIVDVKDFKVKIEKDKIGINIGIQLFSGNGFSSHPLNSHIPNSTGIFKIYLKG